MGKLKRKKTIAIKPKICYSIDTKQRAAAYKGLTDIGIAMPPFTA